MRNPGAARESSSAFFTEKYGRQVLRQLSHKEIGYHPPQIFETPEGFVINGKNKTEKIRSLKNLNGKPLSELELEMRPISRGGKLAQSGYIGREESLVEVLASDNETVLGLGETTSHQELAAFLKYFGLARDHSKKELGGEPQGYEWNERVYIYSKNSQFRGAMVSPFTRKNVLQELETIICLDDGASVSFSRLHTEAIGSYGFYQGKQIPYRLDPVKIAQAAGIIQIPEDDSVKALIADEAANITVRSVDEVDRLEAILGVNHFIEPKGDIVFAPVDLAAVIEVAKFYDKLGGKFTTIRADEIVAKTYRPGEFEGVLGAGEVDLLAYAIPDEYPELMEGVIRGIERIEPLSPKYQPEYEELIDTLNTGLNQGPDSERYSGSLLAKAA